MEELSFELLPFDFYEFLNTKDKRVARVFLERREQVKLLLKEGILKFLPSRNIFVKDLLKYFEVFNTYLERDIVSFLQITDTIKFRKLTALLSSETAKLISYEKLAAFANSYLK